MPAIRSEIPQPIAASRPLSPRTARVSSSMPATKKSIPRPSSDSSEIDSSTVMSPSSSGPKRMPPPISRTTSATRMRSSPTMNGTAAAMAAIVRSETIS